MIRPLLRFLLAPVGRLIEGANLWMIKKSCVGHIDGVAISDNSIAGRAPENFLKATREAMALIKELDIRRYHRVCRQFSYIVNKELVGTGSYNQKLKMCNVDFSKFSSLGSQRRMRRYASLLIHESTHGVISEKGIPYNEDYRLRIERLCHKEEYRFALHFEPGFADRVIGSFKPERWKLSWGLQGDRTAAAWRRLREAIRGWLCPKRS